MNTNARMLRLGLAMTLVAALAAPAAAYAIPGRGSLGLGAKPKPSMDATRQAFRDQKLALLRERIALVLKNREERFGAAADRIASRITRVSGVADQVEKAGGDVSGVRTSLAKATELLAQAREQEATAIRMFTAVPDAANKKEAFDAAKAQGRLAKQTLQEARLTLRNAILSLRAIANGLKSAQ